MKNPLLIICTILCIMNAQFTDAQTLNQGLIAHYCLNGDAVDVAGNKHGTLMNGAFGTTDRANNPNGAIRLDGVDDFIQLPSDPWITGNFSFSGWINVNTNGSWPHLWGFGNGTNAQNIFVALDQNGNNRLHFTTHDCGIGSNYQRVVVPTVVPSNQWFHLVVVMDGNNVSIYKDNLLWTTGTSSNLPCSNTKDSAFIGKSNFTFNNNDYVDASIDDFRFYNRAITAQEITALYQLTDQ